MKPQDSQIHCRSVSVVMGAHLRMDGCRSTVPSPERSSTRPACPPSRGRRRRCIVVRGGAERLEVLLAQRTPKARFMGGAWVFPGGAVDAPRARARIHRVAAVREVQEEVGITLPDPDALVPFARWITPPEVTIRFDTWFFLAEAPEDAEVVIDGSEIVDARWFEPARALEGAEADELLMVFPTIKNLEAARALQHRRRAARVGAHARGQAGPAARRGPGRDRAHRHRRRERRSDAPGARRAAGDERSPDAPLPSRTSPSPARPVTSERLPCARWTSRPSRRDGGSAWLARPFDPASTGATRREYLAGRRPRRARDVDAAVSADGATCAFTARLHHRSAGDRRRRRSVEPRRCSAQRASSRAAAAHDTSTRDSADAPSRVAAYGSHADAPRRR